MATLRIPDKNVTLQDPFAVRQFLDLRGIVNERWAADRDLPYSATNEQVLSASYATPTGSDGANG